MVFFATRLRELRQEKRMTQAQVAAHVGITRSMISSYETDIRLPSFDILLSLARLFQVSTDYLLSVDERRYIDVTELSKRELDAVLEMVSIFMASKSVKREFIPMREVVNL